MKHIAIFVSGAGESAERIVKLFNEGNRLRTVLVVADEEGRDVLAHLHDIEGVELLLIPESEWQVKSGEISGKLKDKDVKLIVLDGFEHVISDEIMEAVEGELLRVSDSATAPREVVRALESPKGAEESRNIQNGADAGRDTAFGMSDEETEGEQDAPAPEGPPSLEHAWAKSLKIEYKEPKGRSDERSREEQKGSDELREGQRSNDELREGPPEIPIVMGQPFHGPNHRDGERKHHMEPMPSTWLVWSVLVTIFCCFIPGIVAIIFSSQVSSRYFAGDIEGAKRSSRNAEAWIIVSFVIGVISATLYLPFMLLG